MTMERWYSQRLLILLCVIAGGSLVTEGSRNQFTPETFTKGPHGRSLAAVYDVGICRWFQDASCQLNPIYAEHVLSSSLPNSSTTVQSTILDEAECLSMTHEAACISHKSCEWVEQGSASIGNTQNRCQLSDANGILEKCTYQSLRPFVMNYMRCRKQLGGSCSDSDGCEYVKISDHNQGCGISGPLVLDRIIGTPASQTEVIARLVESATALRKLDLPGLSAALSPSYKADGHDGRRRLMQGVEDGPTKLEVQGVLTGSSGPSIEKTEITGTGSIEGDETSSQYGVPKETSAVTTSQTTTEEAKETSTTDDESAKTTATASVAAPEPEAKEKGIQGSLTFDVSDYLSSDVEKPSSEQEDATEASLEAKIRQPLALNGPTEHLMKLDISKPVTIHQVADILESLTTVLEEGPTSESVGHALFDAATALEAMRFRLDTQTLQSAFKASWNSTDAIWWLFQRSADSLDAAYSSKSRVEETQAIVNAQLVSVVQISREIWTPGAISNNGKRLRRLERRLEALRVDTEEAVHEGGVYVTLVDTLDKMVSLVVDTFNETLHETYPHPLRLRFTRKFNQTWVHLFISRNEKWSAVRQVMASKSPAGEVVRDLLQGLYRIHSPETPITAVPRLHDLESIVDELAGALSATAADRYEISNLPESLKSEGLAIWQSGPQITATLLDRARKHSIRRLEESNYVHFEGFLHASDKITGLLEAVISLIDAKVSQRQSTQTIPEETAILLTMEAALNVMTDWNNFAVANKLDHAAKQAPFGHPSISDYGLSLVGCIALGKDENDRCGHMDRSRCHIKGLYRWNSKTGSYRTSSDDTICVPDASAWTLRHLFDDLPEKEAEALIAHTKDLFFITAYCPYLEPGACTSDERCELGAREGRLECRPSSNFMNFIVEAHKFAGLAASSQSCRAYLELPVCSNLRSFETCRDVGSCQWTQPHLPLTYRDSGSVCITDWVAQLRSTDPATLAENGLLPYNVKECQEQKSEKDCRQQHFDENESQNLETQLPDIRKGIPNWVAPSLAVGVPLAVALALYLIWRTVWRSNDAQLGGKKKGKGKKKGETAPRPIMPPPKIYQHCIEMAESKRDDFAFVMEAFEAEHSFTGSRTRITTPDHQMDRYASCTTAEISEIQPVSEHGEEESSESDDFDGDDGWTSSSEEWSDNDDGSSLPDLPS